MPKSKDELAVCEDIGIVPIFEYLRRAALSDIRLGVLSGSLVIIPTARSHSLGRLRQHRELNRETSRSFR